MNRFLLRSFALLALGGSAALAQTLYVPGGTSGIGSIGGGNVGVGTSTPITNFAVVGGVASSSAAASGPSTNFAELLATSTKAQLYLARSTGAWANTWWELTHDSDNSLKLGFSTVLQAQFVNGTATFFGNVGIGTLSPSGKFTVVAAGGDTRSVTIDTSEIKFRADSVAHMSIIGPTTGKPYLSIGDTSSSYQPGALSSQSLVVMSNGNIGIGTTSPNASLVVTKPTAGDGALIAAFGSSVAQRIQFFDELNSSQGPKIYSSAGYPFVIGGAGNLVLQPAGNVGIGTTNPTYPLTVNGTVRAKEVIVDTGWSDYVFQPEYRLAPLHEVEKTIATEGHLPGIPSAKEVAEHGISVGEMQAKLLAKIEELTLHQIEQEKRQEQLSRTVEQLQQENATLRTELTSLRKP